MENATKALLIAAGVLFAIVVLSLVLVGYEKISEYYNAKQSNISQEQLAKFNSEYAAYDRDDVTGFELVTLINKAIDFNERELDEGYTEMSVKVKIESNDYNEALFKNETIEYKGKNDNSARESLKGKIEEMQDLEKDYTAEVLTKLVTSRQYEKLQEFGGDKTVKDIFLKDYNISGLEELQLLKYEDYLTFKRADFRCTNAEYENGQIVRLEFEQT